MSKPEMNDGIKKAMQELRNMINTDGEGFIMYGWGYEDDTAEEHSNLQIPVLQNGSAGETVRSLQILLIGNKCSCGSAGADGKYGSATENAVMMYQDKNGLPVTGICDAGTWKKLLGL